MTLKEQLKAKLDARAALVKAAIDAGRAMTEDEQKQYADLGKEIVNLEATIKAFEEEEKRRAAENTPTDPVIFAQPKNPNEKKWKGGLGEYLIAVANASRPGGRMDERLVYQNAASGANEAIGSEGGFLLETDFIQGMQDAMMAETQVANRIRKIPISSNTNRLRALGIDETSRVNGSRWGGVLAYWTAEADTVTANKPKFREIDIKLEKLMALCYITDELLQDASALETIVRQAYADEISFKLDDAIINGTGVGQPLGILNAPALISVAKEAGQAADTILYENVLKMWTRMPARFRKNAVWYINQEDEPQLYSMYMVIGTGGVPVYLPASAASGGQYSTLFNRPVIPIEQCQKLGDKGDIILVDPTQYIGIDKDNIQSDVSIHVRFVYDESLFRFIYRFNGAPYRSAAITPYKGNDGFTLSPYITLDARA
jgi:HK97 family phage major capsid protein